MPWGTRRNLAAQRVDWGNSGKRHNWQIGWDYAQWTCGQSDWGLTPNCTRLLLVHWPCPLTVFSIKTCSAYRQGQAELGAPNGPQSALLPGFNASLTGFPWLQPVIHGHWERRCNLVRLVTRTSQLQIDKHLLLMYNHVTSSLSFSIDNISSSFNFFRATCPIKIHYGQLFFLSEK